MYYRALKGLLDLPRTSNNSWPTSLGGKAFDTGLVLAWMEEEMKGFAARFVYAFLGFSKL